MRIRKSLERHHKEGRGKKGIPGKREKGKRRLSGKIEKGSQELLERQQEERDVVEVRRGNSIGKGDKERIPRCLRAGER